MDINLSSNHGTDDADKQPSSSRSDDLNCFTIDDKHLASIQMIGSSNADGRDNGKDVVNDEECETSVVIDSSNVEPVASTVVDKCKFFIADSNMSSPENINDKTEILPSDTGIIQQVEFSSHEDTNISNDVLILIVDDKTCVVNEVDNDDSDITCTNNAEIDKDNNSTIPCLEQTHVQVLKTGIEISELNNTSRVSEKREINNTNLPNNKMDSLDLKITETSDSSINEYLTANSEICTSTNIPAGSSSLLKTMLNIDERGAASNIVSLDDSFTMDIDDSDNLPDVDTENEDSLLEDENERNMPPQTDDPVDVTKDNDLLNDHSHKVDLLQVNKDEESIICKEDIKQKDLTLVINSSSESTMKLELDKKFHDEMTSLTISSSKIATITKDSYGLIEDSYPVSSHEKEIDDFQSVTESKVLSDETNYDKDAIVFVKNVENQFASDPILPGSIGCVNLEQETSLVIVDFEVNNEHEHLSAVKEFTKTKIPTAVEYNENDSRGNNELEVSSGVLNSVEAEKTKISETEECIEVKTDTENKVEILLSVADSHKVEIEPISVIQENKEGDNESGISLAAVDFVEIKQMKVLETETYHESNVNDDNESVMGLAVTKLTRFPDTEERSEVFSISSVVNTTETEVTKVSCEEERCENDDNVSSAVMDIMKTEATKVSGAEERYENDDIDSSAVMDIVKTEVTRISVAEERCENDDNVSSAVLDIIETKVTKVSSAELHSKVDDKVLSAVTHNIEIEVSVSEDRSEVDVNVSSAVMDIAKLEEHKVSGAEGHKVSGAEERSEHDDNVLSTVMDITETEVTKVSSAEERWENGGNVSSVAMDIIRTEITKVSGVEERSENVDNVSTASINIVEAAVAKVSGAEEHCEVDDKVLTAVADNIEIEVSVSEDVVNVSSAVMAIPESEDQEISEEERNEDDVNVSSAVVDIIESEKQKVSGSEECTKNDDNVFSAGMVITETEEPKVSGAEELWENGDNVSSVAMAIIDTEITKVSGVEERSENIDNVSSADMNLDEAEVTKVSGSEECIEDDDTISLTIMNLNIMETKVTNGAEECNERVTNSENESGISLVVEDVVEMEKTKGPDAKECSEGDLKDGIKFELPSIVWETAQVKNVEICSTEEDCKNQFKGALEFIPNNVKEGVISQESVQSSCDQIYVPKSPNTKLLLTAYQGNVESMPLREAHSEEVELSNIQNNTETTAICDESEELTVEEHATVVSAPNSLNCDIIAATQETISSDFKTSSPDANISKTPAPLESQNIDDNDVNTSSISVDNTDVLITCTQSNHNTSKVDKVKPNPDTAVVSSFTKVIKIVTKSGNVCYLKLLAPNATMKNASDENFPIKCKLETENLQKNENINCKGCNTKLIPSGVWHQCVDNFCCFCECQLTSRDEFELHMFENHITLDVRVCPFCGTEMDNTQLLETHLREHTSLTMTFSVCVGCRIQFRTSKGRELHSCTSDANICTACNVNFSSRELLVRHTCLQHQHVDVVRQEEKKEPILEIEKPWSGIIRQEISAEPILEEEERGQEKVISQEEKNAESIPKTENESKQDNILSVSSSGLRYECEFCDKGFPNAADLLTHRAWHFNFFTQKYTEKNIASSRDCIDISVKEENRDLDLLNCTTEEIKRPIECQENIVRHADLSFRNEIVKYSEEVTLCVDKSEVDSLENKPMESSGTEEIVLGIDKSENDDFKDKRMECFENREKKEIILYESAENTSELDRCILEPSNKLFINQKKENIPDIASHQNATDMFSKEYVPNEKNILEENRQTDITIVDCRSVLEVHHEADEMIDAANRIALEVNPSSVEFVDATDRTDSGSKQVNASDDKLVDTEDKNVVSESINDQNAADRQSDILEKLTENANDSNVNTDLRSCPVEYESVVSDTTNKNRSNETLNEDATHNTERKSEIESDDMIIDSYQSIANMSDVHKVLPHEQKLTDDQNTGVIADKQENMLDDHTKSISDEKQDRQPVENMSDISEHIALVELASFQNTSNKKKDSASSESVSIASQRNAVSVSYGLENISNKIPVNVSGEIILDTFKCTASKVSDNIENISVENQCIVLGEIILDTANNQPDVTNPGDEDQTSVSDQNHVIASQEILKNCSRENQNSSDENILISNQNIIDDRKNISNSFIENISDHNQQIKSNELTECASIQSTTNICDKENVPNETMNPGLYADHDVLPVEQSSHKDDENKTDETQERVVNQGRINVDDQLMDQANVDDQLMENIPEKLFKRSATSSKENVTNFQENISNALVAPVENILHQKQETSSDILVENALQKIKENVLHDLMENISNQSQEKISCNATNIFDAQNNTSCNIMDFSYQQKKIVTTNQNITANEKENSENTYVQKLECADELVENSLHKTQQNLLNKLLENSEQKQENFLDDVSHSNTTVYNSLENVSNKITTVSDISKSLSDKTTNDQNITAKEQEKFANTLIENNLIQNQECLSDVFVENNFNRTQDGIVEKFSEQKLENVLNDISLPNTTAVSNTPESMSNKITTISVLSENMSNEATTVFNTPERMSHEISLEDNAPEAYVENDEIVSEYVKNIALQRDLINISEDKQSNTSNTSDQYEESIIVNNSERRILSMILGDSVIESQESENSQYIVHENAIQREENSIAEAQKNIDFILDSDNITSLLIEKQQSINTAREHQSQESDASQQFNEENQEVTKSRNNCLHCNKKFDFIAELNCHYNQVHFCKLCRLQLQEQFEFEHHMIEWHSTEKICQFCDQEFRFNKDFLKHLRVHTSLEFKPLTCPVCNTSFNKADFLNHNNCSKKTSFNRDLNISCNVCKIYFENESSRERHIIEHHASFDLCPICSQQFSDGAELVQHVLSHSEVEIASFKCYSCHTVCQTEEELNEHTCTPSVTQLTDILCTVCKKLYVSSETYESHLINEHSIDDKCAFCSEAFESLDSLKKHLKYHINENSEVNDLKPQELQEELNDFAANSEEKYCKHCKVIFVNRNSYERHMMEDHTTDKVCQFCDLKLKSTSGLIKHIASHTKLPYKPHKCNKCEAAYSKESFLFLHSCSFPCKACLKTFKTKLELTDHETKVHFFKCELCPRKFNNKTYLIQHIKVHAKPESYCAKCKTHFSSTVEQNSHQCTTKENIVRKKNTCTQCSKTFSHFNQLSLHIKRTHRTAAKSSESAKSVHNKQPITTKVVSSSKTSDKSPQQLESSLQKTKSSVVKPKSRIIEKHNQETTCSFCNVQFTTYSAMLQHAKLHSVEKVYCCEVCSTNFDTKDDLKHHKCSARQCQFCKKTFSNYSQLKDHMVENHVSKLHCTFCEGMDFPSPFLLANHYISEHNLDFLLFNCGICQLQFYSQKTLRAHTCPIPLKKYKESLTQQEPFITSFYSEQSFETTESVVIKEEPQDDWSEQNSELESSSISFLSLPVIKTEYIEEDVKPDINSLETVCLLCNHCNQFFTNTAKLNQHYCEIRFCKICKQTFRNESGFIKHMMAKHSTDKVCQFCDRKFKLHRGLKMHIKTHTRLKNTDETKNNASSKATVHSCKICEEHFTSNHLWESHMMKQHSSANVCQFCNRKFVKNSLLVQHLKRHTKLKYTFQIKEQKHRESEMKNQNVANNAIANDMESTTKKFCVMCNKTFVSKPNFDYHMIHKHDLPKTCQFCGSVFKSRLNLLKHMGIHTTVKLKISCEICALPFNDVLQLETHKCTFATSGASRKRSLSNDEENISSLQKVQKITSSSETTLQETSSRIKCLLCPKMFETDVTMKQHLKTHHRVIDTNSVGDLNSETESPSTVDIHSLSCNHCNMNFENPSELRQHAKKARVYCDFCRCILPSSMEYESHMLELHDMIDTCQFCGAQFSEQTALSLHLRKHTSLKPLHFKCFQCNEKFNTESEKQKHPCKAWTCLLCGQRLPSEDDLDVHKCPEQKVFSKFYCESCQQEFNTIQQQLTHQKSCSGNALTVETTSSRYKRKQNFGSDDVAKHQKLMDDSNIIEDSCIQTDELICPTGHCNHIFSNKFSLHRHLISQDLKCKRCNRSFETPTELEIHCQDKHWLNCELCECKFVNNARLEQHLICHKSTDKHVSENPASTKVNVSSKQIRLSTENVCDTCGKQLGSKQALMLHKRSHQVFQCEICTLVFTSARKLSSHMARHPSLSTNQDSDDDIQVILEVPHQERAATTVCDENGQFVILL